MIRKAIVSFVSAIVLAASYAGVASAHVIVKPSEGATAAFQTFTMAVPNERDVPVVKLRLTVPAGLKYVSPNVKPGWSVETAKDGDGENAVVKEITWSGGSIPVGQRDDFVFSAQLPAKAATLQWKAYQSYEDGKEVAWDQPPKAGADDDDDSASSGPFSETKVSDNPAGTAAAAGSTTDKDNGGSGRATLATVLSVLAIVLSVTALTRKRPA